MHRILDRLLAFRQPRSRALPFSVLFKKFQSILERNNLILELMADMGDKLGGEYVFDRHYIEEAVDKLGDMVFKLISDFSILNQRKNTELFLAGEHIRQAIAEELAGCGLFARGRYVVPMSELSQEMFIQAGTKMASLGEIKNRLTLPIPDGFVITSRAFHEVMEQHGLLDQAARAEELWRRQDEAGLKALAAQMQEDILKISLPRHLASRIHYEYDRLLERFPADAQPAVVLRSSAFGEDGINSFAGQYETVVNVSRSRLTDGYRQVLASTYAYHAWRYRLAKGYREQEIAMAVGCQVLVDGLVSGVVHTYAPQYGEGRLAISAIWGLCAPVVRGDCPCDFFLLDRQPPFPVSALTVADKPRRLVPAEGGGTVWQDNPPLRASSPSLSEEQLRTLAQAAMDLERFHKQPLEIEWTFDKEGSLFILQLRPLQFREPHVLPPELLEEATKNAEIVLAGQGQIAQIGVAVGEVFRVEDDTDLDTFPHGAIMVCRHTSPRYAAIMAKAKGIITDFGSPTGHMANLSREFRVPTIVNTEQAMALLKTGDEITLDATHNTVYRGRLNALNHFALVEEEVFEDCYEYRLLRQILKHITPLNLINPQSENFVPASCRTYHDITRFIHETAVDEIIRISEKREAQHLSAPKRLIADVPLDLLLIDAGGGTSCAPESQTVTPDQVVSIPLKELLAGLVGSGLWCTQPVDVGLGSFMASLTRTFSASLASPHEVGRNLAVVMPKYMDINLRLGYHFTIIDAYISEAVNDNYIYFRFLGGATDFIRRSRRAECIALILASFDFRVEVHGDIVVGRLKKLTLPRMAERMRMIGGLICYTRQLDVQMNADADITLHTARFAALMNTMLRGKDDSHPLP